MLGKLIKYEWKATWKLLVPLDLFIVVMAAFAYLTIKLHFFEADSGLVFMSGSLILAGYGIGMLAVSVVTVVYLIYRFYTSVYGDQGYLLHTLPVDKHQIIIAKVTVSTIWMLICTLLIPISFISLFSTNTPFIQNVADKVKVFLETAVGNELTDGFTAVMMVIALIFAIVASVLKIAACLSLGQLSANHKLLVSFAFYFAIYMVQRIWDLIYSVLTADLVEQMIRDGSSLFGRTWETSLIGNLIQSAIFYFITWYMMDKKLNLD